MICHTVFITVSGRYNNTCEFLPLTKTLCVFDSPSRGE